MFSLFSKRKGTTAAKLPDHIQSSVKKDRVRTLMMLGEAKLDEFSVSQVGKETSVLFEHEQDGYWEGYSSNYLRVKMKTSENLKNTVRRVGLTSYTAGKLIAENLQ